MPGSIFSLIIRCFFLLTQQVLRLVHAEHFHRQHLHTGNVFEHKIRKHIFLTVIAQALDESPFFLSQFFFHSTLIAGIQRGLIVISATSIKVLHLDGRLRPSMCLKDVSGGSVSGIIITFIPLRQSLSSRLKLRSGRSLLCFFYYPGSA